MQYKEISRYIFIMLILISELAFLSSAGASDKENKITIAIGKALPPYVIQDDDTGIEVDIIRNALRAKGYIVDFQYLPNLRIPIHFKKKIVNGIAANAAYDIGKNINAKVYHTNTTIVYQNYAIALESRKFKITRIDDLVDKKVIGFQNATNYLGPVFASMAKRNKFYEENASQNLQVNRLYKHRTDVVISDKRIFLYWRNNAVYKAILQLHDVTQPTKFYPIFPPAPRRCSFSDEKVRNDFNEGLEIIHKNGTYDKILAKYKADYNGGRK